MLPNLALGLAHHTPRPELAKACAALGLNRSGTLPALAERAATWVDRAPDLKKRQLSATRLMSQLRVVTLRKLAEYVLEKPRGRTKRTLAQAIAERFVPEPKKALQALGFEVIAAAGEGAFGEVYKVRRPHHEGRFWAAKVVAGDARTLAQEAASLARLRHVNILQYFNDFPGPVPVIVTEWCGGGSLTQRLGMPDIRGTFTVAHVAKEVAKALVYLHRKGAFHRDLHPGNVLFRKNGELVVADFGLSRRMGVLPRVRHYNRWLGDPAKAPDGSYDVFMLGRMLVSMRNGEIKAWFQSDVRLPKANRRFWGLVQAALDPKPGMRPTAADFVTAIEEDFTPAQLRIGKERLVAAATA